MVLVTIKGASRSNFDLNVLPYYLSYLFKNTYNFSKMSRSLFSRKDFQFYTYFKSKYWIFTHFHYFDPFELYKSHLFVDLANKCQRKLTNWPQTIKSRSYHEISKIWTKIVLETIGILFKKSIVFYCFKQVYITHILITQGV